MSFDEEHTSFYVYKNIAPIVLKLPDAEIGLLFRNMLLYETDQKLLPMDPPVEMAFLFIKNGLDVDYKKWQQIREAQSIGGKIGAKKRWSDRSPKDTYTDYGLPKDSHYIDIDIDNDIDNKAEIGNLKQPKATYNNLKQPTNNLKQPKTTYEEPEGDIYAFARSIGCKVDEHGIIYDGAGEE